MSSGVGGDERQAAAEPTAQLLHSADGDIDHLPDYLRQLQNVMDFDNNSFPLKSRPSDTDAFGSGLFSGEENEGFFGDIDDIPISVPVLSEHRFKPPPTPKFGPRSPAHPTPDWNFITRHGSRRCPSAGSRCPSLVSGGTASSYCPSLTSESTSTSRNSSTRSAKSLRWMSPGVENMGSYEVEGSGLILYIKGLTKSTGSQKRTSKSAASDATSQTQSVPPGESRITSEDVIDDSNITSVVEYKDRPRKCPVESCEYHVKGFVRAYDQMRHVGTHNKTQMICGFCPVSANGAEKSFRRYEIFSRHLSSVHGADPLSSTPILGKDLRSQADKTDRKSRRRELYATGLIQNPTEPSEGEMVAACTMCLDFFSPQGMMEHLPGCVLRQVMHRSWDQDSQKSSNSNDKAEISMSLATTPDTPVSTSPREAMPARHRKVSGTHVDTHDKVGESSIDTHSLSRSRHPQSDTIFEGARRRNPDIFIKPHEEANYYAPPVRNHPRPSLRRRGKQVITRVPTEPSLQFHDTKRLSRNRSNVIELEDCYSATDSESGEERIARLRFGLRSGNRDNGQDEKMRSPAHVEANKLPPKPERERGIISTSDPRTEVEIIPDTLEPQVARKQVPKRISAVSLAVSLISDDPSDSENEGRNEYKKAVAEMEEKCVEPLGLVGAESLQSKSSDTTPVKTAVDSSCHSPTTSNEINSSDEETDWTEETSASSPQSDPGSQLHPILSPIKQDLVDQIMREFHRLFDNWLPQRINGTPNGIRECNGGAAGGNSSQSTSGGKSSVGSSAHSYVNRKRSISNRGSPPPNRDGDNDEDPNKRRRPDPKRPGGKDPVFPDRRFACPYYKRNPGRHLTFTSCRDPGFNTVARLK
ncbi:hypothetical protein BCR34DRAFT_364147 [Clohesyomyces aquaticus]|uniref:C2H2-type domain-containing protein n=1 Tax=Clohesyomyces aquaticus TaxID=1231657 RepID=A0A1Y1ZHS0_9PLEO|nr:hypothetical protein BCR34DRAFT_364147 [Clohesyomyces aquaticus]